MTTKPDEPREDTPRRDPKPRREPKELPGDPDQPDRYEADYEDPVDEASAESMDGSDAPARNVGRLGPARTRRR